MMEDERGRQSKRGRLWLALAVAVAILAVVIVPPLVSLTRYKSRITELMSASLGRAVRLSSVEFRLLPRPGFVLTDLSVEEDPAYGAEPVLHANTVTASIRLLSLWRGRLEISRISVDEASLNLVRTDAGRWNLDPLFRVAAARAEVLAGGRRPSQAVPLPYLVATNSRINIKNGTEKLPFSLVETDLSFWQEEPGVWRIRLRGQPARTDLSLDLPDTGVVRLEATARRAAELREMPVHLDLEWREAQLGQLTRLILGSDPGWRGDLTGELHLDGTADAAQIKTRLRATGVHRAEFAPAAPLDFDALCSFVYHFSGRALEDLACNSPLGDGRIRLAGDLPGEAGKPHLSIELDRIPVAAGLDALRTVRSGFGPGLEAKGTVSGKIAYAESTKEDNFPERRPSLEHAGKTHPARADLAAQGPLTGSFTVEGFQLSGGGLSLPLQIPRLVLEPALAAQGGTQALTANAAISAGGTIPLAVAARLAVSGYQVTVRGQAALARAREFAHVAGIPDAAALDALAGDAVTMDLSVEGPWMPPQKTPFSSLPAPGALAGAAAPPVAADAGTDQASGTVAFRNVNWKADFLANHVEISQATLHLGGGETRWDPVTFTYGPVKGTASLSVPLNCDTPWPCLPKFEVEFGELDASTLQAAILGAREPGTLLSSLIDRLRPSSAPVWPQLEGAVKADSLILGPVTLRQPSATLRILANGAEITGLEADLLGGRVYGSGTLKTAGTDQGKPAYSIEGRFEKLSPPAVGQLLGLRWSGGAFDADGKIDLSGFTDKDLAASVTGRVHFDWRHGSIAAVTADPATPVPAALTRFDRWTAEAEIANGRVTLKQNQAVQGTRKRMVEAAVTLGDPAKVTLAAPRQTPAKRR
jgi:hypothetical protein